MTARDEPKESELILTLCIGNVNRECMRTVYTIHSPRLELKFPRGSSEPVTHVSQIFHALQGCERAGGTCIPPESNHTFSIIHLIMIERVRES